VGQPRPFNKWAVPQCSPILEVPFYLRIHPLTQNYQIWRGNTHGEGLVLGVSHAPTPTGRAPSAPQFWMFPSICEYTICFRTIKFDVVIQVGRGLYLGVSHTSHPRERRFRAHQFWGFLYLFPHPLTQNDQMRHSNIRGGVFMEVSHAIEFAQMRRAVCQRQLRFLLYINLLLLLLIILLLWNSFKSTHKTEKEI